MSIERQAEREIEAIERDFESGELTAKQRDKEIREIEREAAWAMREEDDYRDEGRR